MTTSRVLHLLSKAGLTDRLAKNENDIKRLFNESIDYDAVYKRLGGFIDDSKKFLDKHISEQ